MKCYLAKIQTEGGVRYVGDQSRGLITTLHPSRAARFDMNEGISAPYDALLDDAGSFDLIIISAAACLHPNCNCTGSDEKPNIQRG